MGKANEYQQTFLETVGRQLGYNEDNMPEFKDIETVWRFNVSVWEYNGMTEREFYTSGRGY